MLSFNTMTFTTGRDRQVCVIAKFIMHRFCVITGGGIDYDSGPYTVTFPAGQISVPFDVPINDDATCEDEEDFTLTIIRRTLPDGVTCDGAGRAEVILVDDDCSNN